ncbi:MAG: tyrosine--tRNA ligase, partial [Dehalococcoidia bacterium]|nr:tyrosine--tRNA ligase [Dehalococcoidia bacterium]
PLVTKSDGTKFGKTEGGAVWLDADKTSPFQFYQFWLNTADADVVRFLKYYTLIPLEEIDEYKDEVSERPEKREAQQRLASELTSMTHGQTGLNKALTASDVLFGGDISGLSADELLDIFQDVPSSSMSRDRFEGDGVQLRDLVAEVGLASSRGEARRLIQGGGVSLNNRRVSDARQSVTLEHSVDGQVIVLRRGAKQYQLVRLQI